MKNSLNIIFLLFCLNIYGQQSLTKIYKDPLRGIEGNSAVAMPDHGLIIVGSQGMYGGGIITRIDSSGNIIWCKEIGTIKSLQGLISLVRTKDSCFVAIGYFHYPVVSNKSGYIIKFNLHGDTLWTRAIEVDYRFTPTGVESTPDSGCILIGYASEMTISPDSKVFVIKFDRLGNVQWKKLINGGNLRSFGYSIKMNESGFILTGYDGDLIKSEDRFKIRGFNGFIARISSNGDLIWSKKYDLYQDSYYASSIYAGWDIALTKSGFITFISIDNKPALMKTDFLGNVLWTKRYNVPRPSFPILLSTCHVNTTLDNGLILWSNRDIIKTDSSGDIVWWSECPFSVTSVLEAKPNSYVTIGNSPIAGQLYKNYSGINIMELEVGSVTSEYELNKSLDLINDSVIYRDAQFTSSIAGNCYPANLNFSPFNISIETGRETLLDSILKTNKENKIQIGVDSKTNSYVFSIDTVIDLGTINIITKLGQIVYSDEFDGNEKQIPFSDTKGIYYVEITSGNRIWMSKYIKQH